MRRREEEEEEEEVEEDEEDMRCTDAALCREDGRGDIAPLERQPNTPARVRHLQQQSTRRAQSGCVAQCDQADRTTTARTVAQCSTMGGEGGSCCGCGVAMGSLAHLRSPNLRC